MTATAPSPGPLGHLLTNPGDLGGWLTHLEPALEHAAPVVGVAVMIGAGALAAFRSSYRTRVHASYQAAARVTTILAPPVVDEAGAHALWSHLLGLLRPPRARAFAGQPHVTFEYAFTRSGLAIRIWTPGLIPPHMIERAVQAAWPGAHTSTVPAAHAPALIPPGAAATGGRLVLARSEVLPLESKHDADPLRALLGACTSLGKGEYAAVQILARPVTGRRARTARRQVRMLHTGRAAGAGAGLLDALTPGQRTARRRFPGHGGTVDPALIAEMRAAAGKVTGGLWDARIFYAVAQDAADPLVVMPVLRGRAHALASAYSLYAGVNWLARKKLPQPALHLQSRRFDGSGNLLSVPEIAALAHLPLDAAAPGIERAGARSAVPPPGTPSPSATVKPLGVADTGTRRPVGVPVADARSHVHIIGATGSGKSTLMTQMILDDVAHGRGAVVIDPKGDMITDLLARLPESAAGKVVLLDPDDAGAPPSLNVLQAERADEIDMVTDNLTGIFRRIFAAFWGPRTDDIFRAACLTLLYADPAGAGVVTLADVPRLLSEDAYRRRITAGVTDPVLRGFWDWYERLSDPTKAQVIGPLMNKLRAFLLRGFCRNAIAAGPSSFDMGQVLDGGLCLVRVPKGTLGEETARLLGSFVVGKVWQAAARRSRHGQDHRIDAGLYIDEAHNFLSLPYPMEDMLAEARGYRLSLTLAHQNLAQMPKDLREGISANARTKVFFNASPEDSRDLERHTAPILRSHDLSHLGAYQAACRLVVDGQDRPAFTLNTLPLPPAIPGREAVIRAASRAAYAARPTDAPPAPAHPVLPPSARYGAARAHGDPRTGAYHRAPADAIPAAFHPAPTPAPAGPAAGPGATAQHDRGDQQ
jgi:hypothetical protein